MKVKGGRKRELTVLQERQKAFDTSPGIKNANAKGSGSFTRPGSNNKHKQA